MLTLVLEFVEFIFLVPTVFDLVVVPLEEPKVELFLPVVVKEFPRLPTVAVFILLFAFLELYPYPSFLPLLPPL